MDKWTLTEPIDYWNTVDINISFILAFFGRGGLQSAFQNDIPTKGHLSTKIRKHLTSSAWNNISIYCYFVIKGDTIEDSRDKFEKKGARKELYVRNNIKYNSTKKCSKLWLKGCDKLERESKIM